jgi:hypothetical protein
LHADRGGIVDDVMVGDDLPGRVDDDAGTERLLHAAPVQRCKVAERILHEVTRHSLVDYAPDIDVHHSRGRDANGRCMAARR